MKNMIQKTIVTFVAIITMLSCLALTAFGATPSPRWSHWTMLSGDIVITSDNVADIVVVCDCSAC